MGTIFKTQQGNWRAQVRRKGQYTSRTFRLKNSCRTWVVETERSIDLGGIPVRGTIQSLHTLNILSICILLTCMKSIVHCVALKMQSSRH